jgi:hypothetical protein
VILSQIVWNACAQPGTCADFGEDSTSRMVGRKVFSLPVQSQSTVVDFDMFGWRVRPLPPLSASAAAPQNEVPLQPARAKGRSAKSKYQI